MADSRVVNEWLNKADEDFNFADANLCEGSNFYSQICFHFHQAAEKYFKSFIIAYDLEFEKIHNLIVLLKICGKKEPSLLDLLEKCGFSTPFTLTPATLFTGRLTTQKKKPLRQKTLLKK